MYRDEKTLDGRMTCNYQDCNLEFFQKKMFIEHLAAAHKINIESKNYHSLHQNTDSLSQF